MTLLRSPRSRSRARGLQLVMSAFVAACVLTSPGPTASVAAQESGRREFTVTARKFAFDPPVLDVQQDDLVKVTLKAEDIPHSFVIDEYRIAKRAHPGQDVTFEFRADRPGRFQFYCNLRAEDGCREMRGTLVVRAR